MQGNNYGRRLTAACAALIVAATGAVTLSSTANAAPGKDVVNAAERSTSFNDDWRFTLADPGNAELLGFDDSSWHDVAVPHDWSIHEDFAPGGVTSSNEGLLPAGVGWYRKSFTLPASTAGQRISVDFDGVMGVTTVYLNGRELAVNNYGYTPFSVDITDEVLAGGTNVLALRVANIKPNSRWYTGSGIYRDVELTITDPVHVGRHGTFVTTPSLEADVQQGEAGVQVQTTIVNDAPAGTKVALSTSIRDAAGKTVATAKTKPTDIEAASEQTLTQQLTVRDPQLWSTEDPNLYTVVSDVTVNGRVVDSYQTVTGFRSIRFDTNGLYLNGSPLVLRGMNMHHDLGALGAAANRSAIARQLRILKDAGVNAVRLSHNPASKVLIEEADRMGVVLIEEAFDQWRVAKTANDYSQFFATDAKKDIQAMVNRDKNSPAVIMWSIGNEIPVDETSAATRAQAVQDAKNLNQWVKDIDTTRPTTWGEVSNRPDDPFEAMRNAVDIPGVNYADRAWLQKIYQTHPNHVVLQSEASWGFRSRGHYYNPKGLIGQYANFEDPVNGQTTYPDSWQGSSYDNEFFLGLSRMTTSTTLGHVNEDPHVLGSFLWSGFDYFGETAPYANVTARTNAAGELEQPKNSYSGMIDTAGFPKDLYYLYQSQWTTRPMVHLLPHWNAEPGATVTVWAYTNADTVKLYLNDELVGERSFLEKTGPRGTYRTTADGKLYLAWDVPFKQGTLRAEAFRGGELIATDAVTTAGPAAQLRLTPEQDRVVADGNQLVFVDADVLDAAGNIVPDATNRITFDVTGGEVVGVDNGNPISLERYADSNVRRAFAGKALAIVRPDAGSSQMKITATTTAADGTTTSTTTTVNVSAPGVPGLHATLDQLQAAEGITGPVSLLLDKHLDAAQRLLDRGETDAAIVELEQFVGRLDEAPGRSTVTEEAKEILRYETQVLLDATR